MEPRLEQVNPLLRPLLATVIAPAVPSTVAGLARVSEGGAAVMLEPLTGPRSRILPVVSTFPATTAAIDASTLLGAAPVVPLAGLRAACSERLATVLPGAQLLSTKPGCPMLSPTVPCSDLSST